MLLVFFSQFSDASRVCAISFTVLEGIRPNWKQLLFPSRAQQRKFGIETPRSLLWSDYSDSEYGYKQTTKEYWSN
jgi:hypothetical protein